MLRICPLVAAATGLSQLNSPTLCGSERVCVGRVNGLIVSTEAPDDLSCLTTPGVGRPGDRAVSRAVDQGHPDAHSESMTGACRVQYAPVGADGCVGGRGQGACGLQYGPVRASVVQPQDLPGRGL